MLGYLYIIISTAFIQVELFMKSTITTVSEEIVDMYRLLTS